MNIVSEVVWIVISNNQLSFKRSQVQSRLSQGSYYAKIMTQVFYSGLPLFIKMVLKQSDIQVISQREVKRSEEQPATSSTG